MIYSRDVNEHLARCAEPVQQRFALDCAERAIALALRREESSMAAATHHREQLALKRGHVLHGSPDAAAMIALLNAHFEERDSRPDSESAPYDGALCWALDVESSALESAKETAFEAASYTDGRGIRRHPRPAFARLHREFYSENEQQWQLRRLGWLQTLPPEALWSAPESDAPPLARLDFDMAAFLADTLQAQRALPVAERTAFLGEVGSMLDHDGCWSLEVPVLGLVSIVYSPRRLDAPARYTVTVRDEDHPAPFVAVRKA